MRTSADSRGDWAGQAIVSAIGVRSIERGRAMESHECETGNEEWMIDAPSLPNLDPEQFRPLAALIAAAIAKENTEENDLELPGTPS